MAGETWNWSGKNAITHLSANVKSADQLRLITEHEQKFSWKDTKRLMLQCRMKAGYGAWKQRHVQTDRVAEVSVVRSTTQPSTGTPACYDISFAYLRNILSVLSAIHAPKSSRLFGSLYIAERGTVGGIPLSDHAANTRQENRNGITI